MKIKLIAPKALGLPLKLLGIEVFPADQSSEAKKALEAAGSGTEPAIIFITEPLAADLEAEIAAFNLDPNINITLIPDNQGSSGLAGSKISRLIRNSIGSDIIMQKRA